MYRKISDYGVIGNLHTTALVSREGSVDWLCLPRLDSPSIFGALLDDTQGGRFRVAPAGAFDSAAEYVPGTNVLLTRFRTRTGTMELTDFMPVPLGGEGEPEEASHEVFRKVKVVSGRIALEILFQPRFDYARSRTRLEIVPGGVRADDGKESLTLRLEGALSVVDGRAEARWDLQAGSELWLSLVYGDPEEVGPDPVLGEKRLRETVAFWRAWLARSETGRRVDLGPFREMTDRSALVLKLLNYRPTGTIAAAATTSLPEEIGGQRNWDYRFTWLRDAAFTLKALFNLGHLAETETYLHWVEQLCSADEALSLRIMYGLRGETDLKEVFLDHLDGYKGSRPVRIGNAAAGQIQLDVFGEVMEAALTLSEYVGKVDPAMWALLRSVCDHVAAHWRDKDSGIWEVRDGPHHFLHSKVMCWVALDRGLTIARRYGFPADLERWREAGERIREEVLDKGWNRDKQAFTQHYATSALDSSALLMPLVGFLPFDDPRVRSTIEAVERELGRDGFLHRYLTEDGLPGGEGIFLLCTFWLIECRIGLGELEKAEALLGRVEKAANHLGLFSEEYDLVWQEQLGNFPQALTHIGYINSVYSLMKARFKQDFAPLEEAKRAKVGRLFAPRMVLNQGPARGPEEPREIITTLRQAMNTLRGAFFETGRGRVAYRRMAGSELYQGFLEACRRLGELSLSRLKDRREGLAFWINLYNVLVIHGVIELGIVDSVKEVRGFFRRIAYRVGSHTFTPDDIEHGLLRANSRPPNSLFKPFKEDDPRLDLVIDPPEPRIHFALVCASSSCPPIEVYTPEDLDRELDLAGQAFLNGGGLVVDRDRERVSLSRIFRWYGRDFGGSLPERLKLAASFLYDEEDKDFLHRRAGRVRVEYQDYDWRLNRT